MDVSAAQARTGDRRAALKRQIQGQVCFNWDKPGHFARECRSPRKFTKVPEAKAVRMAEGDQIVRMVEYEDLQGLRSLVRAAFSLRPIATVNTQNYTSLPAIEEQWDFTEVYSPISSADEDEDEGAVLLKESSDSDSYTMEEDSDDSEEEGDPDDETGGIIATVRTLMKRKSTVMVEDDNGEWTDQGKKRKSVQKNAPLFRKGDRTPRMTRRKKTRIGLSIATNGGLRKRKGLLRTSDPSKPRQTGCPETRVLNRTSAKIPPAHPDHPYRGDVAWFDCIYGSCERHFPNKAYHQAYPVRRGEEPILQLYVTGDDNEFGFGTTYNRTTKTMYLFVDSMIPNQFWDADLDNFTNCTLLHCTRHKDAKLRDWQDWSPMVHTMQYYIRQKAKRGKRTARKKRPPTPPKRTPHQSLPRIWDPIRPRGTA